MEEENKFSHKKRREYYQIYYALHCFSKSNLEMYKFRLKKYININRCGCHAFSNDYHRVMIEFYSKWDSYNYSDLNSMKSQIWRGPPNKVGEL